MSKSSLTCESVARAGLGEPLKRSGAELLWRCPHPERHQNGDVHPSLSVNPQKNVWMCPVCGTGGTPWQLAAFIVGCAPSDKPAVKAWLREHGLSQPETRKRAKTERGPAVAEFVHRDERGEPICKWVRHEPGEGGKAKDYVQWRFDSGQWKPGLDGIVPPPYRLPELLAAASEEIIFILESHTDAERATRLGLVSTCFGGCNGWRDAYTSYFVGKDVAVIGDDDKPGRDFAVTVASDLYGRARSVKVLSIEPEHDFRRWCDAQGDDIDAAERVWTLYENASEWRPPSGTEPLSLEDGKKELAEWLSLEPMEAAAVDVALGTVLANEELGGDPLYVIIVAPSSSAKTEILRGLQGAPSTHFLGSLTARTLASGFDPQKASLLLQLDPSVHTLVVKDFGSILAMNPDERGELLQQLRDVYDGLLIRNWGNGKGCVYWEGRLGLLAGSTAAIERELSTRNTLGERFLFYRMSGGDRTKQAARALSVAGRESEMRKAISSALCRVLAGARERLRKHQPECDDKTRSALSDMSILITQSRTPVIRDRYDKSIDIAPDIEGPARTAKALKKLGLALAALYGSGSVGDREIGLLAQVAMSNVPSVRRLVIEALASCGEAMSHKAIGVELGIPTLSVSRITEDLAMLGIVQRNSSTSTDAGQFHVLLNPDFRALWLKVVAFSRGCIHPPGNADRVYGDVEHGEKLNPQNRVGMRGEEQATSAAGLLTGEEAADLPFDGIQDKKPEVKSQRGRVINGELL